MFVWKKVALFAAGVLAGTVGTKLLGSGDAKKVYAHTTAAVLRAKDALTNEVSKLVEGAEDVLAEAKEINAQREAKCRDEIIEDRSAEAEAAD